MISERVLKIVLERPYNRMMEEEADTFGLDLAAKSCYDIRYSSNLWSMMYLNEKISLQGGADNPHPKFFSTHPFDKERADKLDQQITLALLKRETCSCPPLPHFDPSADYPITRDLVDSLSEEELVTLRQTDDADKQTVLLDLIEEKVVSAAVAERAKAFVAAAARKQISVEREKAEAERKRILKEQLEEHLELLQLLEEH